MASASQDLDLVQSVPQALEDVLGLTAGSKYLVENAGDTIIRTRAAQNAPGANARGHIVKPYDSLIVIADAAFKSWFWSDDPDGGKLISTEIPRS